MRHLVLHLFALGYTAAVMGNPAPMLWFWIKGDSSGSNWSQGPDDGRLWLYTSHSIYLRVQRPKHTRFEHDIIGVSGHDSAVVRLYWAGDNMG